jgi:hypothetical protein
MCHGVSTKPNLFVTEFLHQYIAVAKYNAHQIDFNSRQAERADCVDVYCVGSALYPILPLLNHSCNANTIRFNIGNKVILVASRNILKGEKVTDSYGNTFLDMEKSDRQQYYKSKYNFVCECDACTQDYPTFMRLEEGLGVEQKETLELGTAGVKELLATGDTSTAITKTKEMFKQLTETNVSDVNPSIQRLKIMLGTCLRVRYSL